MQQAPNVCNVSPVHRGEHLGVGGGVLDALSRALPAQLELSPVCRLALDERFEAREEPDLFRLGELPDRFGDALCRPLVKAGVAGLAFVFGELLFELG